MAFISSAHGKRPRSIYVPPVPSEPVYDLEENWASPTTASSAQGSIASSYTSTTTSDDEADIEDIVPPAAPQCRRDLLDEVGTSPQGVIPPKNFGHVMPGIYRSGYPQAAHFGFLKSLGLKAVLTLVPGELSSDYKTFMDEAGIAHYQIGIEPNKNPFVTISQCNISAALAVVLNRSNCPVLIHCNKGKHRTGCLVGCLRKIQGWELSDIFSEYQDYATPKARMLDERFIELFDERCLQWLARSNSIVDSTNSLVGEADPSTKKSGQTSG